MDLEKNRIPTKFRHPFVPVTAPMAATIPSTVSRTSRIAGTLTGYVLHTLGVPVENLDANKSVADIVRSHTRATAPRNLFSEVNSLWGRKKMKAAYTQMKQELANNRAFLRDAFGESKVAVAQAQIDKVLANYVIEANSDG